MSSLYRDIYKLVISLVSDKITFCSILLTCKKFNSIGYEFLHVNFNINYITTWACKNNNLSLLEKLLKISKIDPSIEDQYVFRWAAANGYLQIVERLLQDRRGRAPPDGPEGR
jgi:hypothetical protein